MQYRAPGFPGTFRPHDGHASGSPDGFGAAVAGPGAGGAGAAGAGAGFAAAGAGGAGAGRAPAR
jgi:hypothetical protein